MENEILIYPIGIVHSNDNRFAIEVNKKYRSALTNIDGFSHLQVIWWGNYCDSPKYRKQLTVSKPYKTGPDLIGIFGTRSPVRPNPILISTILVQSIDYDNGIINTPYIDAENNPPVLDLKPYHMSDRVRDCSVPEWCKHWPEWDEDSVTFDWQNEFNF